MTTVNDIMALADEYANGWFSGGTKQQPRRAALLEAVEAMAQELEAAKFHTPNMDAMGLTAPTPRAFGEAITKRLNEKWQKEVDALQAKLDAVNDEVNVTTGRNIELLAKLDALEKQEPIYQFRKAHCSDWYDGIPDESDGGGPYFVRTVYEAHAGAAHKEQT